MFLQKIPRRLAFELNKLSERMEFRACDPSIFRYRDCFETIRVLTKIYQTERLCDIGANKGHWTSVLRHMNPGLRHVVLFEPQKKLAQELQQLTLPNVEKVVYNCGLGEKAGRVVIRGGTASASVLQPSSEQTYYFPGSVRDEQEDISIEVLDHIYVKDNLPFPDLIKLDVQGYELNVLKGAVKVLAEARYLVIELSLREFYEGQPPLWEALKFLEENGFAMIARGYEWRSPKNPSELLQMDGIFVNTRLATAEGRS